jgi:hypothetical protein
VNSSITASDDEACGWQSVRTDDPTRDVKVLHSKSDGFHSWSEAEIERFEIKHPVGTRARLPLHCCSIQGDGAGVDVVTMRRQHIRDGYLQIRPAKDRSGACYTGCICIADDHADTPKDNLTFLTTQFGKPFTSNGFGNWFRVQCDAAGLSNCSAHGLRKAAALRLAEAGCTAHEIAAITGHASLKQVSHYTKAVDQKRLATAAMDKAKTRTKTGQPRAWLAK